MEVTVLVLSEGFTQAIKVKHPQEEVNYLSWGMYQSKCVYIRESTDKDSGQNKFVTQVSVQGNRANQEY